MARGCGRKHIDRERGGRGEQETTGESQAREREREVGRGEGWVAWMGTGREKMGIVFVVWNGNYEYHPEVVGFVN